MPTLRILAQFGECAALDLADAFFGEAQTLADFGIGRFFFLSSEAEMGGEDDALAITQAGEKLFHLVALDEALSAADRPRIGHGGQGCNVAGIAPRGLP